MRLEISDGENALRACAGALSRVGAIGPPRPVPLLDDLNLNGVLGRISADVKPRLDIGPSPPTVD